MEAELETELGVLVLVTLMEGAEGSLGLLNTGGSKAERTDRQADESKTESS